MESLTAPGLLGLLKVNSHFIWVIFKAIYKSYCWLILFFWKFAEYNQVLRRTLLVILLSGDQEYHELLGIKLQFS